MINESKILKELEKGTTEEMIVSLDKIKAFIVTKLTAEQAEAD